MHEICTEASIANHTQCTDEIHATARQILEESLTIGPDKQYGGNVETFYMYKWPNETKVKCD